MSDFDLFVIGGGSGGVRCARIAASLGARVAIAESHYWGGTCVNVGCIPKKLMVQAAEYGALCEDSRSFGWGATPGPHDWAAMMAAINHEVGRLSSLYRTALERAGATIFEAAAHFLDPHTLQVGDRQISAQTIVIATGGTPKRPDIGGCELGITSDGAFALRHLPRRVTILGGGYIGIEFAGIFAGLGAEVDLVYRQPLPLRGFDAELRAALAENLTAQGIRLHPTRTIEALRKGAGGLIARCNDGHAIESDAVLLAAGRIPNTQHLNLSAAGITATAGHAIPVDATMQTATPHIYAVGDVTDQLNLTPVATAQGHRLAERLFGEGKRDWNFEAIPTAVFSRPPIASVGLTEEQAAAIAPAEIFTTDFLPLRHVITRRHHHRTLMKLVVDQASQRVLGAHIMGDDAPEMLQAIAVAITAGATKADFDRTIGIHPTAAEEFVTLRTRTRLAPGP